MLAMGLGGLPVIALQRVFKRETDYADRNVKALSVVVYSTNGRCRCAKLGNLDLRIHW